MIEVAHSYRGRYTFCCAKPPSAPQDPLRGLHPQVDVGGMPPLGYDTRDRKLVVNEAEAETVRTIFKRYLELNSIARLRAELDARESRPRRGSRL
jgi:hypothetical protein